MAAVPSPGMSGMSLAEETAAVRDFWQRLELPGLFDVHVHFLPPSIQRAVWAVFDSAGPKIGMEWPIRYRQSHQERVEILRGFGLRRFSTMPYAHKPGVAGFLNEWSADFAAQVPEVIWSATFYPEPEAPQYVRGLLDAGVEVFKIHVQVGEFHLDDPLLEPVWGMLGDAGVPTVIHAGSGPVGNEYTGPAPLARVLARHPRLPVVIAHLGAPEFEGFLELAERYERVGLDTTMVFTEFFPAWFPDALVPRLRDLQERVLLGSDFPTIPYPYLEQLTGLAALGLGDDWLRSVCWENGVRMFGLERAIEPSLPG